MTNNTKRLGEVIAALVIAVATANSSTAQTEFQFIGAVPSTWDDENNWDDPVGFGGLPDAQFDDIAVIGPGDFAFVDNTPATFPGQININSGTLEIRNSGNLAAVPGLAATNGTLNMNGQLFVRPGGTLDVQTINSGGAAGSTITLGEVGAADVATLTVAGGQLNRLTRLEGPNVDFSSSGDLSFGSTNVLVPVITSQGHSIIDVSGIANLDGRVQPEFDGVTIQVGDSWDLVSAAAVTGQFTVDPSAISVQTPRGTALTVTTTATTATLELTNQLLLTANAVTGVIEIENVLGSPITFDAYTISSPSGSLGGNWNSLDSQATGGWDEAETSDEFRLTEVNPQSLSTLSAGEKFSLGTPYAATPSTFGEEVGDLTFHYGLEGNLVEAAVEIVSPVNNFVLTIDPATGEAAFQNESPFFDVAIDAYTITSASGTLLADNANWISLADQGIDAWDEAETSDAFRLTEVLPVGTTLMVGGGRVMDLGTPIQLPSGGEDPLQVDNFSVLFGVAGTLIEGVVRFGPVPTFTAPEGDFNGDGVVNSADYTVWRDNLGNPSGLANQGSLSGPVGAAHYDLWKSNFAATGGSLLSTSTTVPEPSSLLVLLTLVGAAGSSSAARRQ